MKGVDYVQADISNYKILKKKINTNFDFVLMQVDMEGSW